VGKTFKDLRDFDVKRQKEIARQKTKDLNLGTRVKPLDKKKKGGGNNWRNKIDNDNYDEKE
jgi:hypothetical protein